MTTTSIYRRTLASILPLCLGSMTALSVGFAANAKANTPTPVHPVTLVATKAVAQAPAVSPAKPVTDVPALNSQRLFALGMIETGNNDRVIGRAGEISRYQLAPPVWKTYSKSMDYRNPDTALQVARLHWNYLAAYYKEKTGHAPTDFDMYVLWNTRYGYYAHHGFSRRAISPVVQERSERFVNLVNRKEYAPAIAVAAPVRPAATTLAMR